MSRWCGEPALVAAIAEQGAVDLALVLAIDVSASVDLDEFALMTEGLAAAIEDSEVLAAFTSGPAGAVGLAALFWSEPTGQEVVLAWHRIADGAGAAVAAGLLRDAPRPARPGRTAIGAGLLAAARLLARCPFPARRLVVDVSGDGRQNAGPALAPARQTLVDAAITINGLAVANEEPDLAAWFAANLIGGPGAFAMETPDYGAFSRAMREKLVREARGLLIA
ncbi:MAG: DUF1194 domain-containing protein [Acetobacteraceae bacterium]|nr:DUF1194 domain-containing protein [Acetobacteraceae bacterium]